MMAATETRHAETPASPEEERAVTRFLFHEAGLIDADRFKEWLALFTDECFYWLPLERGQEDGFNTVSIVFDDRKLLETRVRRVSHAWFHAQTPKSRLIHFVTNVQVMRREDGFVALSNQIVAEHRLDRLRHYHAQVRHELVGAPDDLRIALKRIDLIDSEGEHRGIPILL